MRITASKRVPDRMTFSKGTQPTYGDVVGQEVGKYITQFQFPLNLQSLAGSSHFWKPTKIQRAREPTSQSRQQNGRVEGGSRGANRSYPEQ